MTTYPRRLKKYVSHPWNTAVDYADHIQIAKQRLWHEREIQTLQNELVQASKALASNARTQKATVSELQRKVGILCVRPSFKANTSRLLCSWVY